MNIIVTGATEFVGGRVIELLSSNDKFTPSVVVRKNKIFFSLILKQLL